MGSFVQRLHYIVTLHNLKAYLYNYDDSIIITPLIDFLEDAHQIWNVIDFLFRCGGMNCFVHMAKFPIGFSLPVRCWTVVHPRTRVEIFRHVHPQRPQAVVGPIVGPTIGPEPQGIDVPEFGSVLHPSVH